ncbi:hypothetical protein [Thermomonas sp.]
MLDQRSQRSRFQATAGRSIELRLEDGRQPVARIFRDYGYDPRHAGYRPNGAGSLYRLNGDVAVPSISDTSREGGSFARSVKQIKRMISANHVSDLTTPVQQKSSVVSLATTPLTAAKPAVHRIYSNQMSS